MEYNKETEWYEHLVRKQKLLDDEKDTIAQGTMDQKLVVFKEKLANRKALKKEAIEKQMNIKRCINNEFVHAAFNNPDQFMGVNPVRYLLDNNPSMLNFESLVTNEDNSQSASVISTLTPLQPIQST